MTLEDIKIAIASDFLSAFANIPQHQQNKVLRFVNKFQTDPTMPGINYEKVKSFKDPNLRSVRIDDTYRAIVLKPEKGNVYVLLWVDHHDKAYKWAQNKRCKINAETGSLQIYECEFVDETQSQAKHKDSIDTPPGPFLFDGIKDKQLVSLGVPEELLPLVRKFKYISELDQYAYIFPQDVYEVLSLLADGCSYEEVYQLLQEIVQESTKMDSEDFAGSLDNPISKQRFYVVENDLELMEMLKAPLEKWRVFLHPSQRKLVERDWNGPVRVLGGAGTGKTVVAMHRAKWLAKHFITGPYERILFTTFTRNLAADILDNLQKICTDDQLKSIDVVNLDRWVSNFLRQNGYEYTIAYDNMTKELWEQALSVAPDDAGLDPSFYRQEWEQVIQPQEITTLQQYLHAPRVGRGIRLNRKLRKQIWPVFEEYQLLLDEKKYREPADAMRDARYILKKQGQILPYKAIIVDEAQDMSRQAFMLLRAMVKEGKNDLFIVGDAHQRIYKHKVVLGQCGIKIIGRSKKLVINYRTTEETRKWAVGLLKNISVDDLDGGIDDNKTYKSLLHGVAPLVKVFDSFQKEVDFIVKYLNGLKQDNDSLKSVCLVARTNDLVKQYENALQNKGIKTYRLSRNEPDDRRKHGVRLGTMHRVKGLEFDYIIISGVNKNYVPLKLDDLKSPDPVIKKQAELRERALLYVSATRAKRGVLVTCFGEPSEFIS